MEEKKIKKFGINLNDLDVTDSQSCFVEFLRQHVSKVEVEDHIAYITLNKDAIAFDEETKAGTIEHVVLPDERTDSEEFFLITIYEVTGEAFDSVAIKTLDEAAKDIVDTYEIEYDLAYLKNDKATFERNTLDKDDISYKTTIEIFNEKIAEKEKELQQALQQAQQIKQTIQNFYKQN